jgi:hypothetical protein
MLHKQCSSDVWNRGQRGAILNPDQDFNSDTEKTRRKLFGTQLEYVDLGQRYLAPRPLTPEA